MIKPFTITSIRDEQDGGKTVFFRVTKVTQITATKSESKTMDTATYVDQGKDIDQHVFDVLKQSGWI